MLLSGVRCVFFFFFKQKTAYEVRISDWSSDVCSSDLDIAVRAQFNAAGKNAVRRDARRAKVDLAGPRSATRRFDHDAAARSLSRIAEAAVPAAALTRAAAAGFARNDRKSTRLNSSH